MQEIWKDFPDERLIGAYQVSNHGNIRSLDREVATANGQVRFYKGVMLKLVIDKHGYYRATPKLSNPRRSLNFIVSRVVALAFCNKPDGCNVVNHIDGNKLNNHASNLEWTTVQGNTKHSYANGLQTGRRGEEHHSNKLSNAQVAEIISRLARGEAGNALAKEYGVKSGTIWLISAGHHWSHIRVEGLKPPYGAHKVTKLNEAMVSDIISKLSSGISQKEIAAEYGILQTTVSKINLGTTWSKVKVGNLAPPYGRTIVR